MGKTSSGSGGSTLQGKLLEEHIAEGSVSRGPLQIVEPARLKKPISQSGKTGLALDGAFSNPLFAAFGASHTQLNATAPRVVLLDGAD